MNKTSAIGIFDSGIGGLTVGHQIAKLMPNERIVYFGDTKHLPYGDKSPDSIVRFSKDISSFLLRQKCKMIVVACNTASAIAFNAVEEVSKGKAIAVNVIDPVVDYTCKYEAKTVEEKCDMLMNQDGAIVKELIGIKHLLDHQPKEMYHIVEYNDLCDNPQQTIKDIYKFLDIPLWGHRFINLDQFEVNNMKYDDNIVGQNLHTIETNSINSNNYNEFKENVNDILPKSIIEKYNNLNFWKGK